MTRTDLHTRSRDRAHDHTGETIATVEILGELPGYSGQRRVRCKCTCGETFTSRVDNLRFHERRGNPAGCPECMEKRRNERWKLSIQQAKVSRGALHCTRCGAKNHSRASCPKGKGPSRICPVCCDLPDRRAADGCPKCGKARGVAEKEKSCVG